MNQKLYFVRYTVGALLILMGFLSSSLYHAKAQVSSYPSQSCVSLSNNLHIGSYGTDVGLLQSYLNNSGYMSYTPTNFFGALTFRGVVKYQSAHNLPASGYVGPLTRATIQAESCNGITPTPVPTPVPNGRVSLIDVNPTSAAIGTTITLTGRGFTSTGNSINFGSGVISNVSATTASCGYGAPCATGLWYITFSVPSSISPYCAPNMMCAMYMQMVTPGTYPISVTNAYGTSNSLTFDVTGNVGYGAVSISGVDSPASVTVGNMATWNVHAVTNGGGMLHYNVTWGDEIGSSGGFAAPQSTPLSTSATFTHTYYRAGTYRPTFTVNDDYGHSASTSVTVLVTPMY